VHTADVEHGSLQKRINSTSMAESHSADANPELDTEQDVLGQLSVVHFLLDVQRALNRSIVTSQPSIVTCAARCSFWWSAASGSFLSSSVGGQITSIASPAAAMPVQQLNGASTARIGTCELENIATAARNDFDEALEIAIQVETQVLRAQWSWDIPDHMAEKDPLMYLW
jgi:hypothetical protein